MRFYQHILVLLNTWYLASAARLPYIKSSGYYTPYPPKETSVIYEFQPLKSSQNQNQNQISKSRATRDLAWREFDSFLNGNEEPSCADLRRMWRLARELQQEANSNLESNDIKETNQQMHSNHHRSPFKSYSVDKSSSQEEPMEASQSNKGKNTWHERRSEKLILRRLAVDPITFQWLQQEFPTLHLIYSTLSNKRTQTNKRTGKHFLGLPYTLIRFYLIKTKQIRA